MEVAQAGPWVSYQPGWSFSKGPLASMLIAFLILMSAFNSEGISILHECFSFCLFSCKLVDFLKNRTKILIKDKLSPVSKHGFFWSEENVKSSLFSNTRWCHSVGVSCNFIGHFVIYIYIQTSYVPSGKNTDSHTLILNTTTCITNNRSSKNNNTGVRNV